MLRLRLVKWEVDFNRGGRVDGLFILNDGEWGQLQDMIMQKKEIYLGEVLGKHSEIFGTVDMNEISVYSEDQVMLSKLINAGRNLCGYNPLDYYEKEEV